MQREPERPANVYVYGFERKEKPMSPFTVVVVLILTVLFIVLSVIPLLPIQPDMDSSRRVPGAKKKVAHFRLLRKYPK
jgi:hypothetical protein